MSLSLIGAGPSGAGGISSLTGFRVNGAVRHNGDTINLAADATSVTVAPRYGGSITDLVGNTGLSVGNNSCAFTVVAQDGVTELDVTLTLHVLSNVTSLSVFTINGEDVTDGGSLELDGTHIGDVIGDLTIVATKTHAGATVGTKTITPSPLIEGANVLEFDVTAEDGTVQHYNVTLTVAAPVEGVAVDLIILPTGTNDALVTAVSLLADTIGDTTGWTWALAHHDPAEHTRYRSGALVRRTPLTQDGDSYDGGTGKKLEFDIDEANSNASTPLYEEHHLSPPVATLNDGITVTFLLKAALAHAGADGSNFEPLYIQFGGGYAICQVIRNALGLFLVCHGNGDNGHAIEIDPAKVYSCTLRANEAEQKNELCVVDNATGEFIGSSEAPSEVGSITKISRQSYLLLSGTVTGEIQVGIFGIDYTNVAMPLEPLTIDDPPENLLAAQVDTDKILLTYDSRAQRVLIQRRVNAGAWSTIAASFDLLYDDGYTDTDVVEGSAYDYRLRGLVGDSVQSEFSAASNAVTVANDAETEFVTSVTPGGSADVIGERGMKITVGADPISVSEVGMYGNNVAAHAASIDVVIRESDGTEVDRATVTWGTASQFYWAALGAPVTLLANTSYFIMAEGLVFDRIYNSGTVLTHTAAATIDDAAFGSPPAAESAGANRCYGPVSFKYELA